MIDLTAEIGLLESRIADLAKRLDSGESGERWRQACDLYSRIMKSRANDDPRTMLTHLHELGAILKAGDADWQTWKEIEELIMKKAQIVETVQRLRSEGGDPR